MQYDSKRATAFYNFQGLRVMTKKDVEDIRRAAETLCLPIGHKVKVMDNYGDFQIDESVADDY